MRKKFHERIFMHVFTMSYKKFNAYLHKDCMHNFILSNTKQELSYKFCDDSFQKILLQSLLIKQHPFHASQFHNSKQNLK